MSPLEWVLIGLAAWFVLSVPFALFAGAFIRAGSGQR